MGGEHTTHCIMYPSTLSYRSSKGSSRHLKRTLRRQEADAAEITMINHDTGIRSRLHSQGSASEKQSSVSSACSTKECRRKESQAPIVVLLRTLLMRCFTGRRKRRIRGSSARKINDNNRQFRGDTHIPTNAHEMFFQLHSKSKRSLNGQLIAGSNHSSSSARRSPSGQLSHNSREGSASLDTKPRSRHITPPVIVIEHRNEEEEFFLS